MPRRVGSAEMKGWQHSLSDAALLSLHIFAVPTALLKKFKTDFCACAVESGSDHVLR